MYLCYLMHITYAQFEEYLTISLTLIKRDSLNGDLILRTGALIDRAERAAPSVVVRASPKYAVWMAYTVTEKTGDFFASARRTSRQNNQSEANPRKIPLLLETMNLAHAIASLSLSLSVLSRWAAFFRDIQRKHTHMRALHRSSSHGLPYYYHFDGIEQCAVHFCPQAKRNACATNGSRAAYKLAPEVAVERVCVCVCALLLSHPFRCVGSKIVDNTAILVHRFCIGRMLLSRHTLYPSAIRCSSFVAFIQGCPIYGDGHATVRPIESIVPCFC